jgi:hypothetical protein
VSRPKLTFALVLLAAGCGSSPSSAPPPDGGGLTDTGPADGALFGDAMMPSGCVDSAKLVYVVTTQNQLWSFDPGTLAFKKIGTLDCPTTSTPESMAIDEKATAYVAMMDGALFTVDTSSAHCKTTSYALEQQKRRIYDMAFVRGSGAETLFVSTTCCYENGGVNVTNNGGGGLAKLALPSYALSLVGDWTNGLEGYPAALAGTGDGRLFAFVPNLTVSTDAGPKAQPTLALVDTTQTGSAPTPSPIALDGTKVGGGAAYAFSFWGGDFWFYSASSTSAPSTVTRWRYATNRTYAQVVADTGMTIIGAGVSSCAPLNAPN